MIQHQHRLSAGFDPSQFSYVESIIPAEELLLSSDMDYHAIQWVHSMRQAMAWAREHSTGNYRHKSTCDLCGAWFKTGTIFQHEDGTPLVVGWQCEMKYMDMGAEAEVRHEQVRQHRKGLETIKRKEETRQLFAELNDLLKTEHYIVHDILSYFNRTGKISEKQYELLKKIKQQVLGAQARKAADDAKPRALVPETDKRTTVEGKVLTVKWQDSYYGGSLKALVEVETPEGFYKLWGTLPSNLDGIAWDDGTHMKSVGRGDVIRFNARVQRSEDDSSFGFYSRPTKAEALSMSLGDAEYKGYGPKGS